jgi:carbon-monoxide dehydrogenase medium subunit
MRNFLFFQPSSLEELLACKKEQGKRALVLTGGTNLLVYIKDGVLKEGTIVDISRLEELKGIHEIDGRIEIGAAETMTSILENHLLGKRIPFIPECATHFANPLVRNTSTIGGNVADASPIADTAPPLMVLDAAVVAANSTDTREISLDEFFIRPRETALEEDEVLVKFLVPVPRAGSGKFIKLGLRWGTSCSVASAAVWLVTEGGKITAVRLALGGVAPRPLRAKATEAALLGAPVDADTIDRLTDESLGGDIAPITDVRGSADYRREVSSKLAARAVKYCAGLED